MREESQLDAMRAAIRGDFARLEQRRGTQELMEVRELEPEPILEPAQIDVIDAVEQPTRSWLARLLAAIPPWQV